VCVEASELTRLVAQLTGSADIGSWRSEALRRVGVASGTVRLFGVSGDRWSAVLRILGLDHGGHPNWRAGEEPEHWYYWRREALAYVAERSDGGVAPWL
jgi:hypothetical protein